MRKKAITKPKFGKIFIVPNNPLVVKQVKNVFSHCEHHLALMYNMTVTVAYLPCKVDNGYAVIGLSKIPRIVDMCCKRLQCDKCHSIRMSISLVDFGNSTIIL